MLVLLDDVRGRDVAAVCEGDAGDAAWVEALQDCCIT